MLDNPLPRCPECGSDLDKSDRLSYEDKLICALKHPVEEHRMIAIETLGRLHSQAAVREFADMLETAADPYVLRAIVKALAEINSAASRAVLTNAAKHRFRIVRVTARRSLARTPCRF